MMPLALLLSLCAPAVSPTTARALVLHESGGNPYAIHVNAPGRLARQPRDRAEAVATARALLARGYSIDLGLAQINAANLPRLGLGLEQVFDPCINLQAMQALLIDGYLGQASRLGPGQAALRAALSAYNTGSPVRGLRNGYVAALQRQVTTMRGAPSAIEPITAAAAKP